MLKNKEIIKEIDKSGKGLPLRCLFYSKNRTRLVGYEGRRPIWKQGIVVGDLVAFNYATCQGVGTLYIMLDNRQLLSIRGSEFTDFRILDEPVKNQTPEFLGFGKYKPEGELKNGSKSQGKKKKPVDVHELQ